MKNNKKGFTLAELLIVVAIIGVLIAIALPTFTNTLENSRKATDEANCRSAYGEAVANYLSNKKTDDISLGNVTYTVTVSGDVVTVRAAASSAGLLSTHYKTAGIKCVGGAIGENT